MSRTLATAGFLLCSSALCVLGSGSAQAQAPAQELPPGAEAPPWKTYHQPNAPLEAEVWELFESLTSGAGDRALVHKRLLERGPKLVPILFGMLTGEVLDHDREAETRGSWSEVEQQLGVSDRLRAEELVYETLAALPPRSVVDYLESVITTEAPTEYRVLAARVLALAGGPRALEVLIAIIADMDPLQLQRPYLRGPFVTSLETLMSRHPRVLGELPEELEDLDLAVVLLIAESLPTTAVREGIPCALELFGRDGQLDLILMGLIAEMASSPIADSDPWSRLECQEAVRLQLRSEDWRMRRTAAVAAAKLHDLESLEQLAKMIDDEHRSVQRVAAWSLQEMTGQRIEADRERWLDWIEAERAWFAGPRQELEWSMLSGRDSEVIAGIRGLMRHPLYRDSAAELLGPLLQGASPGVFGAARAALIQLDSPRAVAFFVPCLESQEDLKRSGAWSALRSLTTLDLPAEREAWERELGI